MSNDETSMVLGKVLGELKNVSSNVKTMQGQLTDLNREVGEVSSSLSAHVINDQQKTSEIESRLGTVQENQNKCRARKNDSGITIAIKELQDWTKNKDKDDITGQVDVSDQSLMRVAAKTGIQKLISMVPIILLALLAGAIMVGFLVADLRSNSIIEPKTLPPAANVGTQ